MIDDLSWPSDTTPAAAEGSFTVEERWIDRVVVLSVSGALDMLTAPRLTESVRAAAAQAPRAMIIDLAMVDFLASAGMTALIAAHVDLTPTTRFGVVADSPSTSRPMKLIGVDTVVALYRTLDDALRGLSVA
jgi:anti-anti-sigma factor